MPGFINISNLIKPALALGNLALAVMAIFLGVRGGYAVLGSKLDPGVSPPPAVSREKTTIVKNGNSSVKSDFDIIAKRNLFDTRNTLESPGKTKKAEKTDVDLGALKETKLRLKLWGTITGSKDLAMAIIEDPKLRRQDLYRVGDQIRNARIKMILREKVVLSVNGKDESLTLEEKKKGRQRQQVPAGPEKMDDVPPPPPPPPDDAQQITISRNRIDSAIRNVNELMKQVRIRPHFTNGQPDGLALSGVRPGSIFRDIGLRSGDIITGVDGDPIRSVDDALKLYTSLKDASGVQLKVKRGGRERIIDYSVE